MRVPQVEALLVGMEEWRAKYCINTAIFGFKGGLKEMSREGESSAGCTWLFRCGHESVAVEWYTIAHNAVQVVCSPCRTEKWGMTIFL
jgi:hypothetical protein